MIQRRDVSCEKVTIPRRDARDYRFDDVSHLEHGNFITLRASLTLFLIFFYLKK